jgi:CheY-like chemotaxis protein
MLIPPYLAIVDDDESVLKALKRLLRGAGPEVRSFASAKALLVAVEEREPEAVISDIQMPEMSGLELHEAMLRRGRNVPFIFITAFDDDELRQRILDRGAAGFLVKPFDRQVILDLLLKVRCQTPAASAPTLKLRLTTKSEPGPILREHTPVDFQLADLHPCPFCNQYPRLEKAVWYDERGDMRHVARIVCPRCQAVVRSAPDLVFTSIASAAGDAQQRWNRRAAPRRP